MKIKSKPLIGSLVLVIEALGNKAVGLISTLILARVLVPEDFGVVAIAVILLGIIEVLGNTGGMQFLLKKENLEKEDLNTFFSINFIIKSVLSVAFFSSSSFAASFFNDDRLVSIIQAFSILVFIRALQNPAEAILRREHDYNGIVKLNIIAKVISVSTAVFIALAFESYWALVLGQILQGVLTTLGLYIIKPYRPSFELSNFKEQWNFSFWLIPQSIFGYLRTQLDTFIVSAKFGKDLLGSYHVMKYLCYLPVSNVITPAVQPLTVELARVLKSKEKFSEQYILTFFSTMLLAIPISSILYYWSDLVTLVLLGNKWIEYSKILSIMSLLIPAAVLIHQANRALIVHGKTKVLFQYELSSFFFIYLTIYFTIGFTDIFEFTFARVKFELFTTLLYFTVITIYFIGIKKYLALTVSNTLVLLASVGAIKISNLISPDLSNSLLELSLKTLSYLFFFLIINLIVSKITIKYFPEWKKVQTAILGRAIFGASNDENQS